MTIKLFLSLVIFIIRSQTVFAQCLDKSDFSQNCWWLIAQRHDKRVSGTWRHFQHCHHQLPFYVAARNGIPKFSVQVEGKNMNNFYQHCLKLRQYRHPSIKVNSSVGFKKLSISK